MANATGIRTRAGLVPSNKALPFSVTTSEVEEYLQKRVDTLAKNGKIERVNIRVYSTEASNKFIPFVVVLPDTVLKNRSKGSRNEAEYIFSPKTEEKNIDIIDPLYQLFGAYIYNKGDENMFFSDAWKREVNVRNGTAYSLKKLRTPKLTTYGGTKVVLFMIDPLRIFHDMVVSDDDKRDFRIDITNIKKMETGKFRYDFKREILDSGKNKKYHKTLIEELNYRMRGRG